MNSTDYATGLVLGVITALVICIIIRKLSKKHLKGQYDERQELIRNRGFKYAYLTALALMAADLLADIAGVFNATPLTQSLAIFTIICITLLVDVLYCIKNDAYFGQGMNPRVYKALMWLIIVCQGVSGVLGIREGAIAGGKLVFGPCSQIMLAAVFLIIMIALAVRKKSDTEAEDEE